MSLRSTFSLRQDWPILNFPKITDPNKANAKNSLHASLQPAIRLSTYFCLFPVQGASAPDTSKLRFELYSVKVVYSLLICLMAIIQCLLILYHIVRNDFSYKNMEDLMFYTKSILVYLTFTQLATKWARLMRAWAQLEWNMRAYGYPQDLAVRCKLVTFIMIFLAIVEHLSFIITRIADASLCTRKIPWISLSDAYFLTVYHQVYFVFPYNLPVGIFLAIIGTYFACAWSFVDLFIIMLSHALAMRFEQINHKLMSLQGKVLPSSMWRQLRESYNELSCLTKLLDQILSPMVLLSFANNLYFISLQLFNSLKPMQNVWEAIYFVYSFTYLLVRICAVSLYAASINDASKECTGVLFSIPSESYSVEVSRFLTQVTSDDLALTGCKFFSVTRTLMLTIAGTIVTYEIVLVQFNAVAGDSNPDNTTRPCRYIMIDE